MLTSNLQEFNARSAETTAQRTSLDDSWSWEMTAARGSETTTHPYSTTTGFTKAVFQLARPFRHITGFTEGVFQLACPFQHIHIHISQFHQSFDRILFLHPSQYTKTSYICGSSLLFASSKINTSNSVAQEY